MLSFPDEPRIFQFFAFSTIAAGRSLGSKIFVYVRRGSRLETTMSAWYSVPFSVTTPATRPPLTMTWATGASVTISPPKDFERVRDGFRDGAHAAAREAPGADRAVHVAHVVVQQHVGGARRIHAHCRADDAAAREMALDRVRLEVLVEEVGDAHRVEAECVVDELLAELADLAAKEKQFAEVPRLERGRVRRSAKEQGPDELALAHHVGGVPMVRIRVARVVARELATLNLLVRVVAEDVAARGDRDAAAVRHDLQAVTRELEVAEQLRPQQAADVQQFE